MNSENKSLKLKFKLKELDIFIIDEMSMVNIDLIGSIYSTFVLVDRKLSLSKWSIKIERVINLFLKKIDTNILMNSIIYEDENKIDQIKNIFKYSN